jgi:hypothetical protein
VKPQALIDIVCARAEAVHSVLEALGPMFQDHDTAEAYSALLLAVAIAEKRGEFEPSETASGLTGARALVAAAMEKVGEDASVIDLIVEAHL